MALLFNQEILCLPCITEELQVALLLVLDGFQVHRLKGILPYNLRPPPHLQEELLVAMLHRIQEDLPQALLFVPQDLSPHHFQLEASKEVHPDALEVLQNEGQHHPHHCHLGGFLVLHFLKGNPAHHLKELLVVLQDALLDIRTSQLV